MPETVTTCTLAGGERTICHCGEEPSRDLGLSLVLSDLHPPSRLLSSGDLDAYHFPSLIPH